MVELQPLLISSDLTAAGVQCDAQRWPQKFSPYFIIMQCFVGGGGGGCYFLGIIKHILVAWTIEFPLKPVLPCTVQVDF